MALYFVDRRRKAADHLLRASGLDRHIHFSRFIQYGSTLLSIRYRREDMTPAELGNRVLPPAEFGYSSGEQAAIAFLVWLASPEEPIPFYVIDQGDERLRTAMGEAFALAIGWLGSVTPLEVTPAALEVVQP